MKNGSFAKVSKRAMKKIWFFFLSAVVLLCTAPSIECYAVDYAYITNSGQDDISVINTSDNSVTATITNNVGNTPFGVVVTPDGKYVYVTNQSQGAVTVISASDNTVKSTIDNVGTGPTGIDITPDGKYVYVANQGEKTVSVIRTSDNTVTTTITVGNAPIALGKFIGTISIDSGDGDDSGDNSDGDDDGDDSGDILDGDDDDGGCFIATAAFGSYMEPHVKILRDFRDACLLTNRAGQGFVKLYYKYSPPVADYIAEHGTLKAAVRCGLYPLVGLSYVALHTTPAQQALMVFGLVFAFSGVVMVRRRVKKPYC